MSGASKIYLCEGCREHHCHTCNPDVCEHGNNLCLDTAAENCGPCLTDISWDRANVADLDAYRGK